MRRLSRLVFEVFRFGTAITGRVVYTPRETEGLVETFSGLGAPLEIDEFDLPCARPRRQTQDEEKVGSLAHLRSDQRPDSEAKLSNTNVNRATGISQRTARLSTLETLATRPRSLTAS